jgi:hypothetical protein
LKSEEMDRLSKPQLAAIFGILIGFLILVVSSHLQTEKPIGPVNPIGSAIKIQGALDETDFDGKYAKLSPASKAIVKLVAMYARKEQFETCKQLLEHELPIADRDLAIDVQLTMFFGPEAFFSYGSEPTAHGDAVASKTTGQPWHKVLGRLEFAMGLCPLLSSGFEESEWLCTLAGVRSKLKAVPIDAAPTVDTILGVAHEAIKRPSVPVTTASASIGSEVIQAFQWLNAAVLPFLMGACTLVGSKLFGAAADEFGKTFVKNSTFIRVETPQEPKSQSVASIVVPVVDKQAESKEGNG